VVAEYEATLVVGYDTLCEFIDEARSGRLTSCVLGGYRIEITDIAFALEAARGKRESTTCACFSAKSSKLPVMGYCPPKQTRPEPSAPEFLFFGCNPRRGA